MLRPFSIVLMLVIAASASAQNVGQTPAPPSTANVKDPNRIICERQEEIGSRLGGKKVCKTAAEWNEERRQQRQTLEDVQRQATSTGIPSGGI
jgi:invasion protein IalB